jgi:hypothetical protein
MIGARLRLHALLLGLAVAGLWLAAGPARADGEGKDVDCDDIAMQFDAPGYSMTCKDFSDPTAKGGGAKVEQILIRSDDRQQILVAVDMRALGAIYLKKRGLEADVQDDFSSEKLGGWKQTDAVAGWEFAEYTGEDDGGDIAECIAFRRQMNPRGGGFGRKVIGFGCTSGDRADIVATLKKLDAPGD